MLLDFFFFFLAKKVVVLDFLRGKTKTTTVQFVFTDTLYDRVNCGTQTIGVSQHITIHTRHSYTHPLPPSISAQSMAISAAFFTSSSPSLTIPCKSHKPFYSQSVYFRKPLTVKASTTLDYSKVSVGDKTPSPSKVRPSYAFYCN